MFEKLKKWLFVDLEVWYERGSLLYKWLVASSDEWYERLSFLLMVLTILLFISNSGNGSTSNSGTKFVSKCHQGNRWVRLACGYGEVLIPTRTARVKLYLTPISPKVRKNYRSILFPSTETKLAQLTMTRNLENKNLTPTVSLP